MIELRRDHDRSFERRGRRECWRTFGPEGPQDPPGGFGALEQIVECRLPPGGGLPRPSTRATEVVTSVREGTVVFADATGRSGVIQAGEVRRTTAGRRLRHGETNASQTDVAHVFQIRFHPSKAGLVPDEEQKRFSIAERRAGLCVVASPDSRRGSLGLHQDALLYSAILDPGQHLVHELAPGRSAWVHVVQGELTLGDFVLGTGDGAGITAERAVSVTARERTEIFLVDLRQPAPGTPGKGNGS